jgi:hypothetical protein
MTPSVIPDLDRITQTTTAAEDRIEPMPVPQPLQLCGWKRIGFLLVNAWLVLHLFAIIVCPASVYPSSPLIQSGFGMIAPYLHLLYLDHGFHFFAPEPGGSTLVSYRLELPDGSIKTGRFPDRSIQPRLRYHRYFMLSEFLGNGPAELEPLVVRAFARNLCRETGAIRVTVSRVVHDVPSIEAIAEGIRLTDPSLYHETELGSFTPDDLKRPYVPKPKTEDTIKPPTEGADASDSTKEAP